MTGARVVVLGGGGGIGSVATRTLASTDDADEVFVADLSLDAAQATVEAVADARFTAVSVDVDDDDALASLLDGAALVVNCVGPFYRLERRSSPRQSTPGSTTSMSATTSMPHGPSSRSPIGPLLPEFGP